MNTLDKVAVGSTVVVEKIEGEKALKRRLMDMGITKGTSIKVVKIAPLGDPIELKLRNYDLSLRKGDAKNVIVK